MAQTLFPNPTAEPENPTWTKPPAVSLDALPAHRVVSLRKEQGMSRAALARALGVHPGTVRRAERGEDILFSNAMAIINWLWAHGAYAFEMRPVSPEPEEQVEASVKEG